MSHTKSALAEVRTETDERFDNVRLAQRERNGGVTMSQSIALLKRQGHLVQTWPMGKLSVTHRAALKDIGPLRPRLAATYALSSVRLYSRSACLAELQICLRQSLRIAIYRSWRTIKATRECVSILVLERCMVPPHSTVVKSRALA